MKPVIVVAIAVTLLAAACSYRHERVVERPVVAPAPAAAVVVPADPPATATVVVPAR